MRSETISPLLELDLTGSPKRRLNFLSWATLSESRRSCNTWVFVVSALSFCKKDSSIARPWSRFWRSTYGATMEIATRPPSRSNFSNWRGSKCLDRNSLRSEGRDSPGLNLIRYFGTVGFHSPDGLTGNRSEALLDCRLAGCLSHKIVPCKLSSLFTEKASNGVKTRNNSNARLLADNFCF